MVGDILQPTHLLFILIVALLVLGPKRLPEVGRTLGAGLRDFRGAISGESTSHSDRAERPEPEWVHAPPEPPSAEATEADYEDDSRTADHEMEFPSAFDAPSGADAEPAYVSSDEHEGHADQDHAASHAEPIQLSEPPRRTRPTV